MDSSAVAAITMGWQDKIPQNSILDIQEKLKDISEDKVSLLSVIQLKSPIIGLILGFFLGTLGIDRFYKGDIGLGIAKLILTITYFGLIISFVWSIVDLFLVWKGIKQDNLNKIQTILNTF